MNRNRYLAALTMAAALTAGPTVVHAFRAPSDAAHVRAPNATYRVREVTRNGQPWVILTPTSEPDTPRATRIALPLAAFEALFVGPPGPRTPTRHTTR